MTCATDEHIVLVVAPNGEGTPLTEAYVYGTYERVDATLHVVIPTSYLCYYPPCKITLVSVSGGIVLCEGYTVQTPTRIVSIAPRFRPLSTVGAVRMLNFSSPRFATTTPLMW